MQGSSIPLGPRLIGRWEVLSSAIGNMTCATLFHNASSSAPSSAHTTVPRRPGDDSQDMRFGPESQAGGEEREREGSDGKGVMPVGVRDGEVEEEMGGSVSTSLGGGEVGWPVTEDDKGYFKEMGLDWMLPLFQTLRYKDSRKGPQTAGHSPRQPLRTVREALVECYIPHGTSPFPPLPGTTAEDAVFSANSAVFSANPRCGPQADFREISDVTVNVQSALWDYDECQLRSAGGHALMLHGSSMVSLQRCKVGGTGSRADALAQVAVTCADEAECALLECAVELCETGGVVALHNAAVGLERCLITQCLVAVHLADFAQVGMTYSRASAIGWGLVFVPEGGLLGASLDGTCLYLYHCLVEGNLFVGYGRAGDTDIQNTTFSGEVDTIEVLRKMFVTSLHNDKALAAQDQQRQTMETREVTREHVLVLQQDLVLQMLAQAYKVIAHHTGVDLTAVSAARARP
jgi:hypothetical protein